jgi:hypothetical protein
MARKSFEEIRNALQSAIDAGSIRNVDYKQLSEDANRAYGHAVRDLYRNEPSYQDADDCGVRPTEREALQQFRLPYSVLHLSGYLKRVGARGERWNWLAVRVSVARQWAPIADLLTAARPLIVKGRAPRDPATIEPRSNATCQICERQIEAAHGLIAHHGYERPHLGSGIQTASCFGARRLPWQIDREALADWLGVLADKIEDARKRCEHLASGFPRVPGPFVPRSKDDPLRKISRTYQPLIGADHAEYSKWLEIARADAATSLRKLKAEYARQKARFDAWKETPLIIPAKGE